MLCVRCRKTDLADTLIEGSDLLELLGWICGALPGLVYCGWRQYTRLKVCAWCGARDLVRESRAARDRVEWIPLAGGARLRVVSPSLSWPGAFESPRARIKHGGTGTLLFGSLAIVTWWMSTSLVTGGLRPALLALYASACAGWAAYQAMRLSRERIPARRCEAWDGQGRRIPIRLIR